MDYETPDGSQFSLRAVWSQDSLGNPVFDYTNVTAYVDGVAYTTRLQDPPEFIDEADLPLEDLEPVPLECIHPPIFEGLTLAPHFDACRHYLKAPSFTHGDCRPGDTFVADCVLNEVRNLELLRNSPHPNLVGYHGCVVKGGRITHICLERYRSSLAEYASKGLCEKQHTRIIEGIRSGLSHLHAMGLAHNDINPDNICVNADGEPVIIDFDSCLSVGELLLKGTCLGSKGRVSTSKKENDLLHGLATIEEFLHSRPPNGVCQHKNTKRSQDEFLQWN